MIALQLRQVNQFNQQEIAHKEKIMKKILSLCALVGISNVCLADPILTDSVLNTRSAWASSVCAGKVVSIDALNNNLAAEGGVLYKSENIHGGRGPSFLVQKVSERTNKQTVEVRNARCEVIGALGLFATDRPYGSRYYSRSGGSGQDAVDFLNQANLVGSNNILIEGVNGKWIRVARPDGRHGNIRK